MLKYLYSKIVFREVPGEISLALAISGCQIRCEGCNQKELWENTGTPLSIDHLKELINKHQGISCILFMGSGINGYIELNKLAKEVKKYNLKVALYLGEDYLPMTLDLGNFNYIKLGHWDSSLGGLDSPSTNQIMYAIEEAGNDNYKLTSINNKFVKNED